MMRELAISALAAADSAGSDAVARGVDYLVLVPALPLFGFLFCGLGWLLLRERLPRMEVNLVACLTVAAISASNEALRASI